LSAISREQACIN